MILAVKIRCPALFGGAGLAIVALTGCGPGDSPPPDATIASPSAAPPRRPLATAEDAVGAEVCAACHADLAVAQAAHPMARTAAAVDGGSRERWFSDEMLGRPVAWRDEFGPEPRYRRVGEGGVRFGVSGTEVEAEAAVDAVFGSGLRGATPVSFAAARRMRELRLSFSASHDGWIATPGGEADEDPLGDLDDAEATGDCVGCHATALAWDAEERFDPHRAVLGVRCERCHGSGIAHVEAQSAGGEPGPIFHPGRLTAAGQVAFCGQCHRQPTDFEPSEILARDPALARHAGASLMMSACFRESPPETTIGCTECHDPHLPEPAGPARTRAVCRRCHDDPAALHPRTEVAAGADCAGCHLPERREVFGGTPFTDHWVRIPGEETPPPGSTRASADLAWLETLYGPRIAEANPPQRAARLRVGLAELLHLRRDLAASQALLREALALGPDYRTRLKAAALLRDGGRAAEAVPILRQAAEERPGTPHAFFELGDLLLETGDFVGAATPLAVAADLSPDSAGVRVALGRALLGSGRPAEAVAAFRQGLLLSPDDPEALGRLAGTLAAHPRREVRNPLEAVVLAERLANRFSFAEPRSLDVLGAAYAAAGRFDEAVRAAERAVALASRAGDAALATEVRARLSLYRGRRAFIGPLPADPPRR